MRGRWRAATPALVSAVVFVVAAAIAVELMRPTAAGVAGFDTAASVLHFERIATGRHLESFVTATPKPFLTLVDGGLMVLFDDWRAVSWAAIAAFAGAAAAAPWLVLRTAGLLGGVAAAILIVSSTRLVSDVAIAYALAWAVLLCLVAGLAVTPPRRRPVLAGLALAGATLARLEVIAITGTAIFAVIAGEIEARRQGRVPDRSWRWISLGLAALPVMCVHDLLLTGNPLFWVSVSEVFSSQAPNAVLSPLALLGSIVAWLGTEPLVVVLAGIGLAWLWRERRFPLLVGLVGSTLGVGLFLVVIAARGTYVSDRYLGAIDVGLRVAAAFGVVAVGAAGSAFARGVAPSASGRGTAPAAAIIAIAIVSVAVSRPGFLRPDVRAAARSSQLQARHADSILSVVRCAVASLPEGIPMPPADATLVPQTPEMIRVIGPGLLRPRLAHDLDIPVGAVAGIPVADLNPDAFLPAGVIAIHDRLSDRPAAAFAVLEIDQPTPIGTVLLTPLVADPTDGVWVDWIGRPGGPEAPRSCASPG